MRRDRVGSSTHFEPGRNFDYIIVGAGTAGCVLAARLSENPQHRVCLVEAGGSERHPFIRIPAAVGAALRRNGTEEDNSKAVAFLLSDDASFVNGEILNVDGGAAATA